MIRQFQQARSLVPVLPDASCTERLTTLNIVHVRSFFLLCRIFCAAMEGTSVRFFFAEVGGRCCLERISLSLSVCLSVLSVCFVPTGACSVSREGGRVGGCMITHLLEGAVQTSVYILLVLPLVFFFQLFLLLTGLTLHSLERLQPQQQHQYCLPSLLHSVFFSPTKSKLESDNIGVLCRLADWNLERYAHPR